MVQFTYGRLIIHILQWIRKLALLSQFCWNMQIIFGKTLAVWKFPHFVLKFWNLYPLCKYLDKFSVTTVVIWPLQWHVCKKLKDYRRNGMLWPSISFQCTWTFWRHFDELKASKPGVAVYILSDWCRYFCRFKKLLHITTNLVNGS